MAERNGHRVESANGSNPGKDATQKTKRQAAAEARKERLRIIAAMEARGELGPKDGRSPTKGLVTDIPQQSATVAIEFTVPSAVSEENGASNGTVIELSQQRTAGEVVFPGTEPAVDEDVSPIDDEELFGDTGDDDSEKGSGGKKKPVYNHTPRTPRNDEVARLTGVEANIYTLMEKEGISRAEAAELHGLTIHEVRALLRGINEKLSK